MVISYVPILGDLLHYGHFKILKKAKKESDLLICGVLSDDVSQSIWGTPLSSLLERKKTISSITFVDKILIQKSISPETVLLHIKKKYPQSKIKYFHANLSNEFLNYDTLKRLKIKIVKVNHYEKLSRENIKSYFLKSKFFNNYKLLSDKGTTLLNFKKILKKSNIPQLKLIKVSDFKKNPKKTIKEINRYFSTGKVVIRSSFSSEDNFNTSSAGKYLSILNIKINHDEIMANAIKSVINSNSKKFSLKNNENIIVQRQTTDSKISGVIFTKDINTNSHYYLINYTIGTDTTLVTSGKNAKLIKIKKEINLNKLNQKWKNLLQSVREIEDKLTNLPLDIEFSINNKNQISIFQIRPIVFNLSSAQINNDKFNKLINYNISRYNFLRRHKKISLYSDMAFWNPSELIGEFPKKLSKSLFEYLITQNIWSISLSKIGYTKINDSIGYEFGNKFYINLDYAFYGLLNQNIKLSVKEALVKEYKKKLLKNINLHDKIEFNIVNSSWNFKLREDLNFYLHKNFDDKLIDNTFYKIKNHTLDIINNIDVHKENLEIIIRNFQKNSLSQIKTFYRSSSFQLKINIICDLLDKIKLNLSHSFCIAARYGFISLSIIKSALEKKLLTNVEYQVLISDIDTVATKFQKDTSLYYKKKLSTNTFLKKYSHLRPNTFDIESRNFDIDLLSNKFSFKTKNQNKIKKNKLKILKKIFMTEEIVENKFLNFHIKSTQMREEYKFILSKYINEIFKMINNLFEKQIDKKKLSHLNLKYLMKFKQTNLEINDFIKLIDIDINHELIRYKDNQNIILPPIIKSSADFNFIEINDNKPNFITSNKASGKILYLKEYKKINLNNKIILIDNADPGFDWIFTFKIKSLITKFGGAASHMAIRCAEFGIPAAIGCGESIFNSISTKKYISIDCAKNLIE